MPYIETRIPGLAELGYGLGRFLVGQPRDDAAIREMLGRLMPQTTMQDVPGYMAQTTQAPTGRQVIGPSLGESASGQAPSLAAQLSWSPTDPGTLGAGPVTPGTQPSAPFDVQPPMAPAAPPPPTADELAAASPAPPGPRREPIERVPVLGAETAPVTRQVPMTSRQPVTQPGASLIDLIRENPRLMGVLQANPGLVPLIQQQQERQQWAALVGGPSGAPGPDAGGAGIAGPTGAAASGAPPTAGAVPSGLPEATAYQQANARLAQLQPVASKIAQAVASGATMTPQMKAFSDMYDKATADVRTSASAFRQAQETDLKMQTAQREAAQAKALQGVLTEPPAPTPPGAGAPAPGPPSAAQAGAAPPPAPPGAAAPGTDLQSQHQGLQRVLGRVLAHPELLGTKAADEAIARLKTTSEILEQQEKSQTEAVTKQEVTTFQNMAHQQAVEASARGDTAGALRWQGLAANPTQGAQFFKDQEAQQQTQARKDLFTKWAADERARGNVRGAQIYEAGALDKDTAEIIFKKREEDRKDALAASPAGAWKAFSDTFGNDVAGELAATPGLTPDKVGPAQVRKAIDNVNMEKTSRAKAGATTVDVKWQPAEAADLTDELTAMGNYRRIAADIRKHPEGWGGPGGIVAKVDAFADRLGLGNEERAKMRNDLAQSASILRKSLISARLSEYSVAYSRWVPSGTEESGPELLAKLDSTAENIQRLITYRTFLKQGGDPTKLPMMATPTGDVDLQTAQKAIQAKEAPAAPAPAGGRTPAQQQALDAAKRHNILP